MTLDTFPLLKLFVSSISSQTVLFKNSLDVFQVQEGLPAGSLLGTLHAKDPDEGENGTIFYSLSGKQESRIFPMCWVLLLPEDVYAKW